MKNRTYVLLSAISALLFVAACATVSNKNVDYSNALKAHVEYLASDELHGRLTGSEYEKMAADYIAKQFKAAKLTTILGSDSYFQEFEFHTPFKLGDENLLQVGTEVFTLDKDWYPVPIATNGKVEAAILNVTNGIDAPDLEKTDYRAFDDTEGRIFLIDLRSPDGHHPHSKYKEYNSWRKRVEMAMSYRPAAIILHHGQEDLSIKGLRKYNNISTEDIPVVYAEDSLADVLAEYKGDVRLSVSINRETKLGTNVLGFKDNGKGHTVVVGAHFDHLGHGEYGNSRAPNSTEVHNGADDNASGTAVVMEMAKHISESEAFSNSNYLFIAFSGEELGLLGSASFTKTEVFDKLNATYMVNFDMVGRLGTSGKPEIGVTGTGTSPVWDSMLGKLDTLGMHLNTTTSGLGSSDHSSFYLKGIPALHYFTGTHEDYHKPSDDADKINYEGMETVLKYALNLVQELDDDAKLKFTKTQDNSGRKSPNFKVTLGIVPSYFGHDVPGLKIDGVTLDKPAYKAGLKDGDVIIKLGDHAVKDMMTYMEALSGFGKGQQTEVRVLRGEEELTFPIKF